MFISSFGCALGLASFGKKLLKLWVSLWLKFGFQALTVYCRIKALIGSQHTIGFLWLVSRLSFLLLTWVRIQIFRNFFFLNGLKLQFNWTHFRCRIFAFPDSDRNFTVKNQRRCLLHKFIILVVFSFHCASVYASKYCCSRNFWNHANLVCIMLTRICFHHFLSAWN